MKRILLVCVLIQTVVSAQYCETIIDGRYGDFSTWNCEGDIGVPAEGDSIVINHTVVFEEDLYLKDNYITITNNGTLCGYNSINILYTSTLNMNGTINCYGLFLGGNIYHNEGVITIFGDVCLYKDGSSYIGSGGSVIMGQDFDSCNTEYYNLNIEADSYDDELLEIIDISGRINDRNNVILLYIYKSGITKKVFKK